MKADSQVRLPALKVAINAAAGGTATSGGLPGRPITFDEINPWSEPVDAPARLTEIAETIGKYVIMDPHQRDAAALGAVFAHTHDLRDTARSSSLFRRRSGAAGRSPKRWIANESSDRRHIRSCRHAEIITQE